ncbi:hypothetical protein FOZ63_015308 [Perkinsus olseni]|uniref:Uncharacterized protein n=2 Tax=Perkinsus olseni TaxID=32597 RepID=A0A7J6Q6P6_PEROL|nr:hypothetical protein FOZ63_015308 [Perkinsus olseni]
MMMTTTVEIPEIMVVDTIREIGEVNHTRMRADGLLIGVDPDLVVGIEKSTIIIIAVEKRGVMMDTVVRLVIAPAATIGSSPAVGPVKAEGRLSVAAVGQVDATIAPRDDEDDTVLYAARDVEALAIICPFVNLT